MLLRINPPTIHPPAPSYSQVLEDPRLGIIYLAGQVGLRPDGELAGSFDGLVTEYFKSAPCTSTLVGVSRLFRPEVSIEIEAVLHR
jgi:enamine deaminase RidA (YjgF/YER057c/UK114 family)